MDNSCIIETKDLMDIKNLNRYLVQKYIITAVIIIFLFSILFVVYYAHNTALKNTNKNITRFNDIIHLSINIERSVKSNLNNPGSYNRNLLNSYINALQKWNRMDSLLLTQKTVAGADIKNEIFRLQNLLEKLPAKLDDLVKDKDRIELSDSLTDSVFYNLSQINLISTDLSKTFILNQENSISFFGKVNILVWIGALLVMHLITIFIFRPTKMKISETTASLEEEKNSALAATQLKSDYLSIMSQQIRTPLNGVLGISALLLETKITPEQKEYLELVRDSGENLLQVVNDIFDFSQIESGNIELEEMYFSIHACIDKIIDTYLPKCKMKNLELIYIIEPDVPEYILGDSQKLNQCLSKLVNNAVKFTRKGEIFIRVNVLNTVDDLHEIQFLVSDTGIGIQESKIKNLFSPLKQSKAPVSKRYEGTGLGLAIVSRLVSLMQGRVWVESEINKGSTFYIAIRFKGDDKEKHVQRDSHLLASKHVIILDHSANNRNILSVQCHNWGMHPKPVSTAGELLDILNSGQETDLIFIDDIILADNPDLIKEIRSVREYQDLPVILLQSDGRKTPAKLKNVVTLLKPIRQASLYDLLINMSVSEQQKKSEKSKINKTRLSVLSAEDNMINQKLTQRLVTRLGHKIDLAMDGVEAVKKAREKNYDIIFMDLQMPEMDGIDATRSILKNSGKHKPKIIAMTANVQTKDKEMCFEAGMIDYIAKPISFKKMKYLMEYWGNVDRKSSS